MQCPSIPGVQLGPTLRDALTVPWPLAGSPWPPAAPQDAGAGVGKGWGSPWGCGLVPPCSASASPQPERTQSCPFCAPILARAAPALPGAGHGRGAGHRHRAGAAAPGPGSCCKSCLFICPGEENPFRQGGFKRPRVMNLRPAPALLLYPAASDKPITALSLNCRV